MIKERAYGAWEELSRNGIRRPQTEADYSELHRFMDDLTSHHDINEQPWGDLFDLVAGYMHAWELEHEPELKNPHTPPAELLAYYLKERGVSAYRVAKDTGVAQSNLSAVLNGRRGVSKDVAKKLAEYFGVGVEAFI